jgi:hypothetical protein
MDYGEELAKARKALADTSPGARRRPVQGRQEDQAAFDFLDRLRRFLLANGAPGREKILFERPERDLRELEARLGWRLATLRVGDQRDEGDTVLVLFSDRTEVAEAEYYREFESCTVPWNRSSGPGPPGSLSPEVIEGVAGFLKAHGLDWDGR